MALQRPTRNFWWARPMLVESRFEFNWRINEEVMLKQNFAWAWFMWSGHPRIDRTVIREAQYQLEVNWCRNEEVIPMWTGPWVGNVDNGGRGLFWRGAPVLVKGPYIVEIDLIVIRDIQYQFEVNRCRNEEVYVK
ncbi:hypothetical protein DPMN_149020 [Dreissena polymorpha]|uniref:Uncharacterized protein n=1 Tax=Dreissena polymorpha TaxID=45954 RepID=A0A9D4J4K1_DREPO|nr:hypothetical protein DPMN_149020 [Dreissena polymorpha]